MSVSKQNNLKTKKQKKKNALIVCRDNIQFWTTQKQFWQWVREGVVVRTDNNPLTGQFTREHEEKLIVRANTILDLSCPNHLREVMLQRKLGRRS